MALEIRENILLAPYTMYKIGGPARYFVEAHNAGEVEEALRYAHEHGVEFFIMGAGSNTLVSNQGYEGMVIRMAGGEVRIEGERVIVDAGVMMARAVTESARARLTGFEWGVGVPGSIGGSVRGNAGCFGHEMKEVVESVYIIDAGKRSLLLKSDFDNSRCEFGYRDSIFKKHPDWVILSATLRLEKSDPAVIQDGIRRIMAERSAKQDIGTKSCGCIFKNPAWPEGQAREDLLARFPELAEFRDRSSIPASFLIDRAGLKGERIGSAVISPRHANFFVNEGGAGSGDVRALIARAKDAVAERYGIVLSEEIQYLGF